MTSAAFGGFYNGRTVLLTGDTGFKGSWLAIWLRELGARVVGYALPPPPGPSLFAATGLGKRIVHVDGDILDAARLDALADAHAPEVVFHLAAQSLVRLGYREPRCTFAVNVMGTVNLLEAARRTSSVAAVVVVTSDKCYRNAGARALTESDELGGYEPYGASKAAAEVALRVWADERFQVATGTGRDLPVASGRAGNCIGGGDWAADRIVPDVVRAIIAGTDVVVRSPGATRPWQHVLDPLSGYLWLGARLAIDGRRFGGPWNFGPPDEVPVSVATLVEQILDRWPDARTRMVVERDESGREAQTLRLDSSKAGRELGWGRGWSIAEALDATVVGYRGFVGGVGDMYRLCVDQIATFSEAARARGLAWTNRTPTSP